MSLQNISLIAEEVPLSLMKPLEDYIEFWERLTPRSLPLIEKLVHPNILFSDQIHTVHGRDVMTKLLQKRSELFPSANIKIKDFAWGRGYESVYLNWSYHYWIRKSASILKKENVYKVANVITELKFSFDSKIVEQREFWADAMPFSCKLYRVLS